MVTNMFVRNKFVRNKFVKNKFVKNKFAEPTAGIPPGSSARRRAGKHC
jgi:hypothetical protein